MEIQHVNCKILAEEPVPSDLGAAIPVFHRWISAQVMPELLVDVADYQHVPDGPGVMVIGHEATYSLDLNKGRLGLLYNRKAVLTGSTREKLEQAYTSAVAACRRLEREPEFQDALKFNLRRVEFIVNDRMLAPNNEASWEELRPEFDSFLAEIFGAGNYSLQRFGDPRERFQVSAAAGN